MVQIEYTQRGIDSPSDQQTGTQTQQMLYVQTDTTRKKSQPQTLGSYHDI